MFVAERKACHEETWVHCQGNRTKPFNLWNHLENIMVENKVFLYEKEFQRKNKTGIIGLSF